MATRIDPRADRSRTAALETARAILVEEGWDSLTHQRVAERSGLHRATIYRHWPTPTALLHEVLAREIAEARIAPTGELRADLLAALAAIGHRLVEREGSRVVTALIDRGEWDPRIAQIKTTVVRAGVAPVEQILTTAVDRGALPPDLEIGTATAQLVGPLLYRRLFTGEAISFDFITTAVDRFLQGYRGDLGQPG